MAFPFSVGVAFFQEFLDWAAQQPPPAQVRDTHALRFHLQKRRQPPHNLHTPQFSGLLFFRPPRVSTSFVGRRPGLEGFGSLLARKEVCQSLVDPTTAVPPAELVRVFIVFRQRQSGPAEVVANLKFMEANLTGMPTETTGGEDFNHIEMTNSGLSMDPPPGGWDLGLARTTVLLEPPF
jgi:hypothetical protein